MKRYPSIPQRLPKRYRGQSVHVFDKIDGSNLRFDWDAKLGWHRWGSRTQIIDEEHPVFGVAWSLFQDTMADSIAAVAAEKGWSACVAFAEFWGDGSFAGHHDPDAAKRLTLFDVSPYKRGILGPEEFMDAFGDLDVPAYLGEYTWDDEFVEQVREGCIDGVTFEGVIGKVGSGHKLAMVKAKTQEWKDHILDKFGELDGMKLLAS